MHCPDGVDGKTYIAMVAATSMLLSNSLDEHETYILAEFLQSVSLQLFTLGAFKGAEYERKRLAAMEIVVPPPENG